MNLPLRLTECPLCISWLNVDNLRNVRCVLRGLTCVFHGMFATHYSNPSAMFWQSVRSRRGPIYRARIYITTHEMAHEPPHTMNTYPQNDDNRPQN